jgi:WD40 repeat protein
MPAERRRASRRGIATIAAAAALIALACEDSTTPLPAAGIPDFVYVADSAGYPGLVRYSNGVSTPLTAGSKNTQPFSAGGRLVFTSERDGFPQIYIADLAVTTPHRVTNSGAFDQSPSLSPSADSIVYVSTLTGVPRLWVIAAPALDAASFGTPAELSTGSALYTPEDAPVWSPVGGKIAFSSVRGGNSQIYVVASGGGSASLLTNETGGAFEPAWSADGKWIYYIAALPGYALRKVSALGGGATTVVAESSSVAGPASCDSAVCLFSTGFNTAQGIMGALPVGGGPIQTVFPRTAAQERQPAVLVP